MPDSDANNQRWLKEGPKWRRNEQFSKSIHLQAMKQTHTSIILEEYEPYSTGKWSMHPHAAALGNTTQSSFISIKNDIEKEYSMYQKVEMQKNSVNQFMTEKR